MANDPNIREIAVQVGVSPSTVSRVLSGRTGNVAVSSKTRQRVLEACSQMKYAPNIHAQRLFSRRSNVIALVVPAGGITHSGEKKNCPNHNVGALMWGVEGKFEEKKQDLLLITATEHFLKSQRYLHLFRSRSIDGMLIWGVRCTDQYPFELLEQNYPFVLVDSYLEGSSLPYVVGDNARAAAGIAEHLLSLGHRDIAYIAGPDHVSVAVDRRQGFVSTCQAAGVDPRIYSCSFERLDGYQVAKTIFAAPNRPTAIAAVNDSVAIGVILAAKEADLRVPEDLSVSGGDNTFSDLQRKLTTFDAPMYEMGYQASELLLQWIDRKTSGAVLPIARRLPAPIQLGDTTGVVSR